MKSKIVIFGILFIVLLTTSNLLLAQDIKTLSMDDCIKICLKNNTDIVAAESNYKSSKADLQSAWGNFMPSINGYGSWAKTSENNISLRNDQLIYSKDIYAYRISAEQQLFTGFSNYATLKQNHARKRMQMNTLDWIKQQTIMTVQLQYYNVLKAKQLLKVSEESLNASKEELVRLETMEEIGSISKAEVYQQKVRVGENQLTLIEAQNNLSKARADLNHTLGIDIKSDFKLEEESLEIQKIDLDFDEHLVKAMQNRIDYIAAKDRVQISKSAITISKSGYYPQVSLNADHSWRDVEFPNSKRDITNFDNYSISVNIGINLFNGLKTKSNIEKSKAQLLSSEAQLEQSKRQVTLDVRIALLEIQRAAERVAVTNENLISSKEDYRFASERYKIGAGTLLEQITAESNLTRAKASRIQALYDYKYSRAYLDLTTGNLNKNY